ncbi:MAG: immunity 26/phosphotriesterase HocA family protein [Chitinophagaceae bacterium]
MMEFELTNEQRKYFGLDPVKSHWDRVPFSADTYRPESVLYYEEDTIKRHIVSTGKEYFEKQYDEPTIQRAILLPKTDKGKQKKLSASVLEQRQPTGVYLSVKGGDLTIGNYNSQTTFYASSWENEQQAEKDIPEIVEEFIRNSPDDHFSKIEEFKQLERRNIKFRSGDYFCFKLDRVNYGFGRVLLDVNKIRKKKLLIDFHGLGLLMGPPVIIELFAFRSSSKHIDINTLDKQARLPSDVMMDNLLLYGEFEIIGHRDLKDEEFDFPISYGRSIDQRNVVFLQWGLIHKELPLDKFNKYLTGEKQFDNNPYGYYSIGFRPHYYSIEVMKAIHDNGIYSFDSPGHYKSKWDLRNPRNKEIRSEIFQVFGLDPNKTYFENSTLTGTQLPGELIKQLK